MKQASIQLSKKLDAGGFGRGMLEGALMPGALPTLLVGNDVMIYAPNNTESFLRTYTCGVNACGAVFFGWFWRVSRLEEGSTECVACSIIP